MPTIRLHRALILAASVAGLGAFDGRVSCGQAVKPVPAKGPTAAPAKPSATAPAKAPAAAPPKSTATTPSKTPAAAPLTAEAAIRANAQAFVDAFNKGDARAVAALWTEDGEQVDESGDRTKGREAIAKKYAAFLAEHPGVKMEVAVDAVRVLGTDTALEDGHSKMTLPGAATSNIGRYLVAHVKRDGKWLMASVRDQPSPPPSSSDQLADLDWMVGVWRAEQLGVEMELTCRWLADKSFVEVTHAKVQGDKIVPTATQIIGVDPRSNRLSSWMFNADKGTAHGVWTAQGNGWAIDFSGITTDGTVTTAVNTLTRVKDALVWKSTNRTVNGKRVPDTDEIVLKRK